MTSSPGRMMGDLVNIAGRSVAPPDGPVGLGDAGMAVWVRVWDGSMVWLSPERDAGAVRMLCEDMDEREVLKAAVDGDDWHVRVALRKLDEQIDRRMAALGLTPASRAKLNTAVEPKTGKLAQLRAKHV